MTEFAFAPAAIPTLPIVGSEALFPVRRVFCVGRNYAEHAREMGSDPTTEPPFFFTKPGDAVVAAAGTVPYPGLTERFEYEVELVVAIGVGGEGIAAASALDHVWGYGVGVDLTRRDRQQEAKDASRPWDVAKGFDASAAMTPLIPVSAVGHPSSGRIWLAIDGVVRQDGDLDQQIWQVAGIVAAASRAWRLEPGDLLMTGTPSGVGMLEPGQAVSGGVDGVAEFSFTVGERPA